MKTFKTSLKKKKNKTKPEIQVTHNWCIGQKLEDKNGFKNKVVGQESQYAFEKKFTGIHVFNWSQKQNVLPC